MALTNDMTEGNIDKQLLLFALPLFISNILQTLYNAVDMFFVGKYIGTAGLSAVSVCGPVMNVLYMTIAGLSMGVTIIIGAHLGHGDKDRIITTANTAIIMYLIISVIATALGLALTPAIVRLISTPAEAINDAVIYMRIIFTGLIFTCGYNLICAMQRGFGDSRSSMYFVLTATVTNIVLDFILIRYAGLGVMGAAVATIASQAVSFIMGIIYFRSRGHMVTFSPTDWCFNKYSAWEILSIGAPAALQQTLVNFSGVALNGIVNTYGLVTSAAYGIGIKIDSFSIQPCSAISDAVSAMTSQNLGAGKEERALSCIGKAQKITIIFNGTLTVLVLIFAYKIAGLFDTNPEVISIAGGYMRITVIMYMFYALIYPKSGFVKGSGNALFSLKNSLCSQYIIRIPLALLLSKVLGLGITGIAFSIISAPIFSCLSYYFYMKRGGWRKRYYEHIKNGGVI